MNPVIAMYVWPRLNASFIFFCSTVHGRIDQVNQVLELDKQTLGAARYMALDRWTTQLNTLHLAIVNKMA